MWRRIAFHGGGPASAKWYWPGPRQEGANDVDGFGRTVFGAAPVQVAGGGHKGGQSKAGLGDASDEGIGIGQRLVVGLSLGPFQADFVGQALDEEPGPGAYEFAPEGANAGLQLANVHCGLPKG